MPLHWHTGLNHTPPLPEQMHKNWAVITGIKYAWQQPGYNHCVWLLQPNMPCSTLAWRSVVERKGCSENTAAGQLSTPGKHTCCSLTVHFCNEGVRAALFTPIHTAVICNHSSPNNPSTSSEHGSSTHQKCQPTGAVKPPGQGTAMACSYARC